MQPNASSFFLIEGLIKISGRKKTLYSLTVGKENGCFIIYKQSFYCYNCKGFFRNTAYHLQPTFQQVADLHH